MGRRKSGEGKDGAAPSGVEARDAAVPSSTDPLQVYRAKRSAERTPEPFGEALGGSRATPANTPRLFVCQKHGARRLHYDLRLEIDGALHSWSVPRGPSYDPAQKRLAVETEPHPLEYIDFEGVIPAGNYGAGAMIVWDRGTYVPVEPFDVGYRKGKLLFELRGYKLHGVWQLVRTKGKGEDDRQWLLIKKPDAFSGDDRDAFDETSVLSGLDLEQLAAGSERITEVEAQLERLGAPRRPIDFKSIEPMLATPHAHAFDNDAFMFELKYDGYRLLAQKNAQQVLLRLRRGRMATEAFPEVARTIQALPFRRLIFDGEAVVLDEAGRPDFQRMQRRAQLTRGRDIEQARREHPVSYMVFDLLAFEDYDLRPLPLQVRKEILRSLLPHAGSVRYCEHIDARGVDLMAEVHKLGLEGLVAKRRTSVYQSTRSPDWLKIRTERTDDFVIIGFTKPQGQRQGLSALLLAAHKGATLRYTGRVGTGFSLDQLGELRALLDDHVRSTSPCEGVPRTPRSVWVEPIFVCEVRYKERTEDGLLRHPVFVRLRDDKPASDCVWPGEALEPLPERPATKSSVTVTNRDKLFWPDEGLTKGDLVGYYEDIARWMLPYLEDRPLVLTRYPDGVAGKSFFQKHAPSYVPDWLTTHRLWSDHAQREIDYFICDGPECLVYLANMATIPIHVWGSRMSTLPYPDWCILDLDPKEAPFSDVVALARAIKKLADEIGLTTRIKTSGSSGLHVLVPLGARYTYEQCKMLAELLARIIVARHPDIATVERNPKKRGGKVYIDFLQNGHGKLLAAPWCVRARPGATVSTPLRWSEVDATLDPTRFTIRTVLDRLQSYGDPMADILTLETDLPQVLDALAERMVPGGARRDR